MNQYWYRCAVEPLFHCEDIRLWVIRLLADSQPCFMGLFRDWKTLRCHLKVGGLTPSEKKLTDKVEMVRIFS